MKTTTQTADIWALGNMVAIFNGTTHVTSSGIVSRGDYGFMVHLASGPLYFYAGESEGTAERPINGVTYTARPVRFATKG